MVPDMARSLPRRLRIFRLERNVAARFLANIGKGPESRFVTRFAAIGAFRTPIGAELRVNRRESCHASGPPAVSAAAATDRATASSSSRPPRSCTRQSVKHPPSSETAYWQRARQNAPSTHFPVNTHFSAGRAAAEGGLSESAAPQLSSVSSSPSGSPFAASASNTAAIIG